jgi:hypothetical protein
MKDSDTSFEPVSRAALRFTGSESLSDVIEHTLIKPELRREFARRSFYLFLRTEVPVDVESKTDNIDRMMNGHDPLESYNAGIAQAHKGHDLYTNHYLLSSRVIGGIEYSTPRRGVSLLFRLAISEYEKQRLLAPPFAGVTAGAVYVTHDIDEMWLGDNVLSSDDDRSRAFQDVRAGLGANHASIRERGYLPDNYHVTHPAAVILQNPKHTDNM